MADEISPLFATALAELRTLLPPGGGRRAVVGVCPGARAVAVAALAEADTGTVVVVPSPRDAEDLAAALRLLFPALPCAVLPVEAVETYHGHTPPLGATAATVHALIEAHSGAVRIVLAPARLLLYPFPEPQRLAAAALRVEPGDQLDPGELATALADGGYRRVEVVEEAGEFAVRGQVIDVASPDCFVRAVLDVDTVERLAVFDPSSQRSQESLERAAFPPLRLFPATARSRTELAARLENAGCQAAALACLDGAAPEWWEGLLGWTAPHTPLWRVLPRLVVCEPAAVLAEAERSLAALRRARAALAGDQVALPEPDAWLARACRGRGGRRGCRLDRRAGDRGRQRPGTPADGAHTGARQPAAALARRAPPRHRRPPHDDNGRRDAGRGAAPRCTCSAKRSSPSVRGGRAVAKSAS